MANPLHDCRTAANWAAAGQVIEINEKLSSFKRLSAIVEMDLAALGSVGVPADWRDSLIAGSLEFGFADARGRLPAVRCLAAVTVDAVCQRCLKAFKLPLAIEERLLLLVAGGTAVGYEDHEVWELEGADLCPQDIVEELLIMALPLSAMHVDLDTCEAKLSARVELEDTTRPFAALRTQMEKDH